MFRIGGQKIPFITVLFIATEGALIATVLLVATVMRLQPDSIWHMFRDATMFGRFALVVMICVLCLYYHDLYDLRAVGQRGVLLLSLTRACGIACLMLAALYYLIPTLTLGRGVAALSAPTILVLIFGWRMLLHAGARYALRPERVLVLGSSPVGVALAREYEAHPEFNIEVVGFLSEPETMDHRSSSHPRSAHSEIRAESSALRKPNEAAAPAVMCAVATEERDPASGTVTIDESCPTRAKMIGTADELAELVVHEKVNRVIIALTERRGGMPVRELLRLKFAGVAIDEAHTAFEAVAGRILLQHLNPSYLIMSNGFAKYAWLTAMKRIIDVVVSLISIVLTAPIMLLVAFAIWAESGMPVLFRQRRVGLKGREFEILKFRSMYGDRADAPPSWTAKGGDKRITRVGRFIRKTRLDELPQFINVLRGEMSLVGPRPEQPYFCQVLEEQIPYYGQRHSVRPGITGWAQVKYQYGASVEESAVKLEHDLFYIKHMSVALDLAILFETAKVMLSHRGAH